MYRNKAYVNITMILLNALYFIHLSRIGVTEDGWFMLQHGAVEWSAVVEQGEYYRLLTAMFMHFSIGHIMNNMLVLFVLGDHLERALGSVKYLIFYLTCGIGANVVSLYLPDWLYHLSISYPDMAYRLASIFSIQSRYNTNVVSAGASGAIFGVVGGLLYAVGINKGRLEDLSSRQLVVVILFSLYFGFQDSDTNNVAHVAGLLLGILMAMILYRKPGNSRRQEAQ